MARQARIVIPGLPHHVTHRGNRRMDIFVSIEDRLAYCSLLKIASEKHGVDIWSYNLMSNHLHLILNPSTEPALAGMMHDVATLYAAYFNETYGLTGHLWEGRFFSCVLDGEHLWSAVRYVERNPVRAGICRHAADYRWSSAQAHCGLNVDPLLSSNFPPPGSLIRLE